MRDRRTRPSVDILPRLATMLGVSIEALVHAMWRRRGGRSNHR